VNCDEAIAHNSGVTGVDVLEGCFFSSTSLKSTTRFRSGTVVLMDCLFAGTVPESVNATGVQRACASTEIDLSNQSLLPTCIAQGVSAFPVECPAPSGTRRASRRPNTYLRARGLFKVGQAVVALFLLV
jgi:hypothetical protein